MFSFLSVPLIFNVCVVVSNGQTDYTSFFKRMTEFGLFIVRSVSFDCLSWGDFGAAQDGEAFQGVFVPAYH